MGSTKSKKLALIFTFITFINVGTAVADDENGGFNLADAFAQTDEKQTEQIAEVTEVEPIVVGRKKWNEKPAVAPSNEQKIQPVSKESNSVAIQELDPLETKQNQPSRIDMKINPPVIPPAVNLHRNFEGKLVLKPRTLGFEKNFPYQLENSKGRRLAFVDMENLKVIDPIDYKDKRVNILGKLEPLEEGKKDLVIRARILRSID
ncbi:MAG: hypothetical protein CMI19_00110 [Opitutae bacterium]|nr:hypothetical protein [Opitutae bacterium]|tara:strand:+ start:1592 stop:2206 length:615 start_codon:yes stop_codon:yes gene_type:complete